MIMKSPTGIKKGLYIDMLSQPHVLIAGATGSGKSVLVNGLIYTALFDFPSQRQFILIDPKRVELSQYKKLPHAIRYASEPKDMINALQLAMDITEKRYKAMQRHRQRKSTESDIYVIIDELADLMTTNKKAVQPLLQRLCQIGRAANIHVIACTQCPLATVIPTPIKVNFDARVGLHTRSAQDSRNILEMSGCETLPKYGKCIYRTPAGLYNETVPYYSDTELDGMVRFWIKQCPLIYRLLK